MNDSIKIEEAVKLCVMSYKQGFDHAVDALKGASVGIDEKDLSEKILGYFQAKQ